jgi:glutamate-ammonia-ligase adenylyltransferase
LSSDDLDRFVEIKSEMSKVRRRKGYWNVKLGEGGIRDLEFFIQMLQMVNAYGSEDLQKTSTLIVLSGLNKHGFLTDNEAAEIRHSYLFLRRLENRLQMIDEEQTHELPDEYGKRLIVAKSMNIEGDSDSEIIDKFETELFTNQSIAKNYFERLLPEN